MPRFPVLKLYPSFRPVNVSDGMKSPSSSLLGAAALPPLACASLDGAGGGLTVVSSHPLVKGVGWSPPCRCGLALRSAMIGSWYRCSLPVSYFSTCWRRREEACE